jgi:hypothetical protein
VPIRAARAVALAGALFATSATAQNLELAVDQSPAGLDPHIVTAFSSFMIVNGTIYEGLTAIDKDLKIVPGLAESWTVSPDGRTYAFKLRPGVVFHDGSPMEAEDVAATVRRVLAKEIASPLASRLSSVETATAGRPSHRRAEAEGAGGAASRLPRHDRGRAPLDRGEQGRLAETAGRHRPVPVRGMAAERLHLTPPARQALGRRAPDRGREVQHRAGIGNAAGGLWRAGSTPCCRTSTR